MALMNYKLLYNFEPISNYTVFDSLKVCESTKVNSKWSDEIIFFYNQVDKSGPEGLQILQSNRWVC